MYQNLFWNCVLSYCHVERTSNTNCEFLCQLHWLLLTAEFWNVIIAYIDNATNDSTKWNMVLIMYKRSHDILCFVIKMAFSNESDAKDRAKVQSMSLCPYQPKTTDKRCVHRVGLQKTVIYIYFIYTRLLVAIRYSLILHTWDSCMISCG